MYTFDVRLVRQNYPFQQLKNRDQCSSRIKTLIYTFYLFFSARILLHSNSVFLSGPKKPRWTACYLPDTCPQPFFHSADVQPDNRPQDGGISPGNGAANCFSSALYPPSAPRRTQRPRNLNPALLN